MDSIVDKLNIKEPMEEPREEPREEPEEEIEEEKECVICYITQNECNQQNYKYEFFPCERCKKTICTECMNAMLNTRIGYFCPMCRFGYPEELLHNNPCGVTMNNLTRTIQYYEEENRRTYDEGIPLYQVLLAAIRRNNVEQVFDLIDNHGVNPGECNNKAYRLAMHYSVDRRILDKLLNDNRVDKLAFENHIKKYGFDYNEYLAQELKDRQFFF
jgi:hypothetical protein